MEDSQATRPSLLVRIRDRQDAEAWSQFVRIYSPLVYGFARTHGLQDADAADLTQEVLRTVARTIGRFDYDPRRGSFRGWLKSVARSRLHDLVARRRRQTPGSGDTGVARLLEEQPSSDEDFWERAYRQSVFDWACGQVRGDFQDSTWEAFWKTSVEGIDTKQVAESLGMSVGAVYIARSRVLARLRKQIEEVDE